MGPLRLLEMSMLPLVKTHLWMVTDRNLAKAIGLDTQNFDGKVYEIKETQGSANFEYQGFKFSTEMIMGEAHSLEQLR